MAADHSDPPRRAPPFLERGNYRKRRVRDAARLLPILGLSLWLVPLLWATEADDAPATSNTMVYVFGVWFILILAAVVLSRWLGDDTRNDRAGPRP